MAHVLSDLGDESVMNGAWAGDHDLADRQVSPHPSGRQPRAAEWATRIQRGRVPISTVTRLEIGYSARSAADRVRSLGTPPLAAMPVEYLIPAIEDRAVEVQRLLARRGQHRAPSIPDLLIAATAELTGRTVRISTRTSN